jgi:hypothetical protein
MSQSNTRRRPDLGTIIATLHDSEINGEVSWSYDGHWRVKLGDEINGVDAEAVVPNPQDTAEWLRANAVRRYPASGFAKLFPRSVICNPTGWIALLMIEQPSSVRLPGRASVSIGY